MKFSKAIILTLFFSSLCISSCVYTNRELMQLNRAENQFNRKQYDKAKTNFNELLLQYPGTSYADVIYERLGEIYLFENQMNKAVESFKLVFTRFPRSIQSLPARFYYGFINQKQNNFDIALPVFYQLVHYLPVKPSISDKTIKSREFNDSNLKFLFSSKREQAVKWGFMSLYQMGDCYMATESYANAQNIFEYLNNQQSPYLENESVKLKLGICYFYTNRLTDAKNFIEKSMRTQLSQYDLKEAYRFLGATEFALGHHLVGIKHMIKYIDLESDPVKKDQARDEVCDFMRTQVSKSELLQLSAAYSYEFPGDYAHLQLIELDAAGGNIQKAFKDLGVFISSLSPGRTRDEAVRLRESLSSTGTTTERIIACVCPLSGRLSSFGEKVLHGVELAVKLQNRKYPAATFTMVSADTRGKAETIPQIYSDLVTKDHAIGVIGPVLSKVVTEAASYAQKYHLPTITPSATQKNLTDLSDFLFRNCLTYQMQVETLLDYVINTLQIRKLCILYPTNTYGETLANEFQISAPRYGATVVQKIEYQEYQTDFQETLSQLEPEYLEGIFIPDFAEKIAVIAPQIPFFGIQQIYLLGSDSWNSDALAKLGGIYVENCIFVDDFFKESTDMQVREFVESYRTMYAEEPDRLAAQAYDAAQVLMKVIRDHGNSREIVREYLLRIKNFPGITGNFEFLPNGECKKNGIILSILNGNIIQKK